MIDLALYTLGWAYVLFLAFTMYASILQAWGRLKIGIKILVFPALLIFGIIDVIFNLVVGSILFRELPRQFTLSQRLCQHLIDPDWRGHIAGAIAVPLNAIYPDHIHHHL